MPEGDTIFRAARTLHRALGGHLVTRFETAYAQLSVVHDQSSIVGRTVERVESQGKHVLMHFTGDLVLRTHMRMSGSWHIYRHGERWQRAPRRMRVLVATADFVAVGFDIPVAEFETARTLQRAEGLGGLGPDLLSPDFDEDEARRRLRRHVDAEIGPALLNQRVVAGIGNVFKSETLFLCGVDPFTRVGALSDAQLTALLQTGRRLLGANVLPGSTEGIMTHFSLRARAIDAEHDDRLWVYGRGNKPCRRCATPIRARKQGLDARITYWCPACQPPAG